MSKQFIYGIITSLLIVATAASACASPGTSPPATTLPGTGAPAPGGIAAPDQGAPGLPTPGAATGITTPVAPAVATSGFVSAAPALGPYNQYQVAGISVSGQGQVNATPDTAYLTLGVDSQASSVATAQSAATNAMNAVMQALKSKGIADNDITTVGYSINPVYDYRNNTNTITGYQVSNTISVTVRKIGDTGAIIDAVAAAGGNLIRVNYVSFGVNDPTPYLKQARAKAMADALDKASQLATLGGVKLGPPTFISESSGYYPPTPIYYGAVAAAREMTTPISPGQTQISASVQVIYGIQ